MNDNYISKQTNKLIFVISAFLFAYTGYRAVVLSITWDEAFSYLEFVRHEIFIPEKYEQMHANNHFLNTWLNIFFVKIFDVSEWVLRLPSLIAHVLFLFFSFKLVKNFENKWLVIASFLIINLNPYILDFFSLSRGYALSLGLMMASIYYLYVYFVNEFKMRYAIYCCVAGALATLANFVILNYFVVSFGIILLVAGYQFLKKSGKEANQNLFTIVISSSIVFLSLWFLVPIALKLKEAGALFYGGNTNFWTDTICTLTERCFYELPYPPVFEVVAQGFVFLVLITAILFLIFKTIKKTITSSVLFLGVLTSLILLCALSTVVQHHFLGTLLLIDRTAMFFVVLFNLLFVFFINELTKQNKKAVYVSLFTNLFVVCHFIWAFNFHYVLEWKSNADVKQMISDLKEVVEIPKEKTSIDICIPLSFDQPINYYRAVNNLTWINKVERGATANYSFDYLYLQPREFPSIEKDSLTILNIYPTTQNILAKPKFLPNRTNVCFKKQMDISQKHGGIYFIDEKTEYSEELEYTINDSITPAAEGEIVFSAKVLATDLLRCDFGIILSLHNKKEAYMWKRAYIKDYIHKAYEWVDVSYTTIIPKETVEGDVLKCYIWNPNKHKLQVKKMELKWLAKR